MDGGAGSVSKALASVFPAHEGEQQKLWNLLTAYELWSGHIMRGFDIKFIKYGPNSVIETGWVLQLQQYTSVFLEKVQSTRTPQPAAQVSTLSQKPKSGVAVDGFESGKALPGGDDAALGDKTSHLTLGSGDAKVRSARVLEQGTQRRISLIGVPVSWTKGWSPSPHPETR